jgi:hypothetical protein
MASIGWKKFKFFDEERHTEAPFPEGVTTACAGLNDDVWLACADGLVVCMDKELGIKSTFPAFKGKVHYLSVSKVRRKSMSGFTRRQPPNLRRNLIN